MNHQIKAVLSHFLFFVAIEVIFVVVLFRELPDFDLFTLTGILHSSYWLVVVSCGFFREKVQRIRQKFICSYTPLVYHIAIHVFIGGQIIEQHHHDEYSLRWIIMGGILLGALILFGESLLHRSLHCETHHQDAHQHCHDKDCEELHSSS